MYDSLPGITSERTRWPRARAIPTVRGVPPHEYPVSTMASLRKNCRAYTESDANAVGCPDAAANANAVGCPDDAVYAADGG